MTTFLLKLSVAVVPFILLVASIIVISHCRQSRARRLLLRRRRTCRSMQKALALGVMVR